MVGEPGLALEAEALVDLRPPEVAVEHHRLLPRPRQELRDVHEGGGLAFLGRRARDQDHLAVFLATSEEERGAEVLVGLGHEVGVVGLVARHRGQEIQVQVALDLLGIAQGVVEIVAGQDEAHPQGEAQEEADEPDLALRGPHRRARDRGLFHHGHVVVLDAGRDVALVELLQQHLVEALARLRLFLQDLELAGLAALRRGHRLLAVDGRLELVLALLELGELGLEPAHDLLGPSHPGLLDLGDLSLDLLHFGMGGLEFLQEPREIDGESPDLAVEPHHHRVGRHLGHGVEALPPRAHVADLLHRGLDGDAPRARRDEIVVQPGDGGGDGRDRPFGHEQVLGLVALEELLLGLAHAALGGGEPSLQPLVGLLRVVEPTLEARVPIDVGQSVGPKRGLLRARVGHGHGNEPALGNRFHPHMGHEESARVGVVLVGRLVVELERLHDLFAEVPAAQDLELGVVVVGVLPVGPRAHERVGHRHEGGGGRVDLDHHPRLVFGGLQEGHEEPEQKAYHPGRGNERTCPPEQVGVVADVEVPVLLGLVSGGRSDQAGHGSC